MVNKASQEYTGVYTNRFEDIYIMIIFSLGFTFSLASVPGEETGIDSLSVPGAGALGSVRSTPGITVSVSDSFRV